MRALGVEAEYVALVEPDTLEPLDTLSGVALLAIAARIGEVRLIDNAILEPARASAPSQQPQGEAITCSA
jgi:pantoate--beta-alanine ligase